MATLNKLPVPPPWPVACSLPTCKSVVNLTPSTLAYRLCSNEVDGYFLRLGYVCHSCAHFSELFYLPDPYYPLDELLLRARRTPVVQVTSRTASLDRTKFSEPSSAPIPGIRLDRADLEPVLKSWVATDEYRGANPDPRAWSNVERVARERQIDLELLRTLHRDHPRAMAPELIDLVGAISTIRRTRQ